MAARDLVLKPYLPPDPLEAVHQERIFNCIPLYLKDYPELALLHAIPNGGWRHPATAAALQRQGVKPGVPDMFLPVPRGMFNGLYIELKRLREGDLSDKQREWLAALTAQGYRAVMRRGTEAAWNEILSYLSLSTERSTPQ